jgi:hypothetical protein
LDQDTRADLGEKRFSTDATRAVAVRRSASKHESSVPVKVLARPIATIEAKRGLRDAS